MTLTRKIMTDARREGNSCIRCGSADGTVCGRHYNGQRQHAYGKGRGIKCHPVGVADLCDQCDKLFPEGAVPKNDFQARDAYSESFQHWCILSTIRRFERGVLS